MIKKEDILKTINVPDFSGEHTFGNIRKWLDAYVVQGYNVGPLIQRMQNVLPETEIEKRLTPVISDWTALGEENSNLTINSITSLLAEAKTISSTNTKKKFVSDTLTNAGGEMALILKDFVYLVYSETFVWGVTKAVFKVKPEKIENRSIENPTIFSAMNDLAAWGTDDFMSDTEKKISVWNLWFNAGGDLKKLIELVISRDLGIRMKVNSFKEIYPDIIIVPYQRCEKEPMLDDRINYPALFQEKADGKFQNIFAECDATGHLPLVAGAINRSGKKSNLNPIVSDLVLFNNEVKYFERRFGIAVTIMGEALIKIPGEPFGTEVSGLKVPVIERSISNGLYLSYSKRFVTLATMLEEINLSLGKIGINNKLKKLIAQLVEWALIEDNTVLQVWDIIPAEDWFNRETKWTKITSFSYASDFIKYYQQWRKDSGLHNNIHLIHSNWANDRTEVFSLFNQYLKMGKEGGVVKNSDITWSHDVCRGGMIKLKDINEADLEVIGYVPGDKQFTGGIGSLICRSSCGIINVNVSGLSRKQRGFESVDTENSAAGIRLIEGHDNNKYNGLILEANFIEYTEDKAGNKSLTSANLVEFRDDKIEADSYERILGKNK